MTKNTSTKVAVKSSVKAKGGNRDTVADSQAQRAQMSGFARHSVFKLAMSGVDFFTAFCGTEIQDKLVVSLRSRVSDVLGASLAKAKSGVLMIDGAKLFAWNVKVAGDTYERSHIDEFGKTHAMRGSLSALQSNYGKSNVRLVTLAELQKLAQSRKVDKGCANALGLTLGKTVKVTASADEGEGSEE